MARHFQCTACGKCCYGQIPLTIDDALTHADLFPLALVWTPLRQGSRDYAMVSRLGTTVRSGNRKDLAVLIVPSAYIPASLPCPALKEDNLCGIHATKPLRCKTMPFYPYREEQYQAELLAPRPGWECDVSNAAPLVFQDRKIVTRDDFDQERLALKKQTPLIRTYAEYMLKYTPNMVASLERVSGKVKAGQVVTSLSSFLTATRTPYAADIAGRQFPVLEAYIERTAGKTELADFHRNYVNWEKEMTYLSKQQIR